MSLQHGHEADLLPARPDARGHGKINIDMRIMVIVHSAYHHIHVDFMLYSVFISIIVFIVNAARLVSP